MTQEEKQLLLQDLCARLPYDTIVSVAEGGVDGIKWNKVTLNFYLLHQIEEEDGWEFVKPYLQPMSSMTEEEKKEYDHRLECMFYATMYDDAFAIDWLNAHYFDYRGLIPKGLALEAPEGMYK